MIYDDEHARADNQNKCEHIHQFQIICLIKNIFCESHFQFKRAQNDLKKNHYDEF